MSVISYVLRLAMAQRATAAQCDVGCTLSQCVTLPTSYPRTGYRCCGAPCEVTPFTLLLRVGNSLAFMLNSFQHILREIQYDTTVFPYSSSMVSDQRIERLLYGSFRFNRYRFT